MTSSLQLSTAARKPPAPGVRFARALLAAAALLLLPHLAFAYVDPNTGGLLFQLLFPILMAVMAAWLFLKRKMYTLWQRILGWLRASRMRD